MPAATGGSGGQPATYDHLAFLHQTVALLDESDGIGGCGVHVSTVGFTNRWADKKGGAAGEPSGEGAVTPRASLGTRHTPGEDLRVQQLVLLANHVLRRGQVVLQRANL